MCGRYVISSSPETIRKLFGYAEQPNFPPRYNVAPTQPIPVMRLANGKRSFALMRWGFIPLAETKSDMLAAEPARRDKTRKRDDQPSLF